MVSRIAARYEINYVKTSTGFGARGASVDDVILIKHSVSRSKTGVKATGGVRTIWDLAILVAAGADIIGSSSGIEIVNQYETKLKDTPFLSRW
jgi:deoxyribose-phosphate aldolase